MTPLTLLTNLTEQVADHRFFFVLLKTLNFNVQLVTAMGIVIFLNPARNYILLTRSTSIRSSAALPSINHKLHSVFAGTFVSSYFVYRSLTSKIKATYNESN